jgi:hypothetical protein
MQETSGQEDQEVKGKPEREYDGRGDSGNRQGAGWRSLENPLQRRFIRVRTVIGLEHAFFVVGPEGDDRAVSEMPLGLSVRDRTYGRVRIGPSNAMAATKGERHSDPPLASRPLAPAAVATRIIKISVDSWRIRQG